MTDEKQQDENGEESADTAAAPESAGDDTAPAQDDQQQAATPAAPRPSRLPLLLSAAAFVLAVLAAAATGTLWLSERGPDPLAETNRNRVESLGDTLQDLRGAVRDGEDRIGELTRHDSDVDAALDDLRRALDARLRPLESVPGRLSALEASLAALQGISSGVRDTWLLAEAEYYMEIANAQLQLAANPQLAMIALQLADERIATIANPGLTDVRRALADELRALEALDAPDIEGAALTLASLADSVDGLPLRNDVVPAAQREVEIDEELSGMQRALASLKNAMSDVISVRRTDQPVTPLLPPDAAYFLRSNVTLQLQAARLALLRGEQALFEQSLTDAANWIGEYFDTERKPVSSALATIDELRAAQTTMARIDISRSLTLLRRFLALEAQERESPAGQAQ